MTLTRVHKGRRLDKTRALAIDVYQVVLSSLAVEEHAHRAARQLLLRDRFILVALRELGLRASELVGARMNAFERLSDPQSGNTYWIFRVDAENAKGGEERTVPVTRVALDALLAFRQAFNLAPAPRPDDTLPLLLSPRTEPARMTLGMVQSARNRRYFGACGQHRHAPRPVPRGKGAPGRRGAIAGRAGRHRHRGAPAASVAALAAHVRHGAAAGRARHPAGGRRARPRQRDNHHGVHGAGSDRSDPRAGAGATWHIGARHRNKLGVYA